MSNEQLLAAAMELPLPERAILAQALWESIDAGLPEVSEEEAMRIAVRRAAELDAGIVKGIPHDEVMKEARRAIECD